MTSCILSVTTISCWHSKVKPQDLRKLGNLLLKILACIASVKKIWKRLEIEGLIFTIYIDKLI
jgi:hypothetical protein